MAYSKVVTRPSQFQLPEFSLSDGQDFAKYLVKSLYPQFCETVDPFLILKCVNMNSQHEQKIRRQADQKSDHEVNQLLWSFLIRESDWVRKLYRALEVNEYYLLLDILQTAVEEWKQR